MKCISNKVTFNSKKEAKQFLKKIKSKYGSKSHCARYVYQCPFCFKYHITHYNQSHYKRNLDYLMVQKAKRRRIKVIWNNSKSFCIDVEIAELNVYVIADGTVWYQSWFYPETRIDPEDSGVEVKNIEYDKLEVFDLSEEEEDSAPIQDEQLIEKVKIFLFDNLFDFVDASIDPDYD